MSFTNVLEKWRGSRSTAEADLAEDILGAFSSEHPQAYDNLDSDPHISDVDRESLLEEWVKRGTTPPVELQSMFEDFCRNGKKRAGPPDAVAQASMLGHAMTRRRLEDWFGSAGSPTSPVTLGTGPPPAPAIDRFLRDDLETQKKKLPRSSLPTYLMWSFYDSSSTDDPFTNTGKGGVALRDRLGLGHVDLSIDDLLSLAHALDDAFEANVPTTFDAETSKWFRPGGTTEPLTGAFGEGMPEVVHDPISREDLLQPVREAQ